MSEGAPRRVGLLGSGQSVARLRRSLPTAERAGAVVLDAADLEQAGDIDAVLVLCAADAFSSLDAMLSALRVINERGLAFESVEEPWLSTGRAESLLAGRASEFFELSIEKLKAERDAVAAGRRQDELRLEVGRLLAQLLVLVPYAVAVGLISQAVLNAALLDPALVSSRIQELVSGSTALTGEVSGALPDALRGIVFSALSSLVLLLFRGTPLSLRAELGGVLFVGVVTACVYGLSAGVGTGFAGALAALPGLVLAGALIVQFDRLVLRITAEGPSSPPTGRVERWLEAVEARLQPMRSRVAAAAFTGMPVLVILVSAAAAFTSGGWLFWPARIALFALVAWCLWAVVVTPGPLRLPLWSALAWAAALLLLSAATLATAVFAAVIVLLLAVNVVDLVRVKAPMDNLTARS